MAPTVYVAKKDIYQLLGDRAADLRLCFLHMQLAVFLMMRLINCKQLIFAAMNSCGFAFIGIFAAIYFRGLKNWTIQEQCKMYLCGYFRGILFSRIHLSSEYRENKSLAKIN